MRQIAIGLRRGGGEWQRDIASLAAWAKAARAEVIDLGHATPEDIAVVRQHGLAVGSIDVFEFPRLLASDPSERRDRVARNIDYIRQFTAMGVRIFFTCILPADPAAKRADNYAIAVETYQPIAEAIHDAGASLAIEGYPGGPPHFGALCCTPETVRTFLKDVGRGAGLNYDPSHLIRLGVDYLRFLKEFAPHVRHVHGKDTHVDPEKLYEFGNAQPATFAPNAAFGGPSWRYTLPGHGDANWSTIFRLLAETHYTGAACIELEDANFNGIEAGEKKGLQEAMAFLRSKCAGS